MLELVGINAKDSSSSNKRSPSLDTRDNQPSRKRIKLPISLCRREAPNSASTSNRSCAGTRTNKGGLVDDTQEYPAHRIHVVLNIDDNVAQDPLQAKRQSNTDTHAGLERDILKACTIYVDVWMSHGENTSPLFYDIAKSLGAQTVKSIGPLCTHIVYTSGVQSTVQKYFALNRKRRPQVVGAAWLKDCRDAATHLGEEPYLVDMEDHCMYNTGTKRKTIRCRRFTPKFYNESTRDEPTSSTELLNTLDDTMSVLEIARNRRSVDENVPGMYNKQIENTGKEANPVLEESLYTLQISTLNATPPSTKISKETKRHRMLPFHPDDHCFSTSLLGAG
ncbi:MAG: hypothetical protein NXY57DRAFT_965008 [Lentinula lateritia]|nr:MAG: hypothetical protein NXY57DRAFT_965008 [Lentinula lateritia]